MEDRFSCFKMTASACTHLRMWKGGTLKLTEAEEKGFFKGSKLPENLKARFCFFFFLISKFIV